MADRRDYYFKQPVTEGELDTGFDLLEAADRAIMADQGLNGITQNADVTEKSGTPNFTVDVSGPGVVYDQAGQRVAWAGTQNVDASVDEGAAATPVVTPGNSKWLSLFAAFDRVLSDPRTDGSGFTVQFVRDESFLLNIVQGAEAPSPARPALRSDEILLADILLVEGQTQIFNSDIDVTRRQEAFVITGATTSVIQRRIKDALQDIVDAIDALVTSSAPANVDKSAAVVGVSTEAARADHKHDISTTSPIEITDVTNAEGSASTMARSDHQHSHGIRGGGTAHADVVAGGADGFMTGTDKTKLDAFLPDLDLISETTSTTVSATDVAMANMSTSLAAGTYYVFFSCWVDHSAVNETITASLYNDTVQVTATERQFRRGGSAGDISGSLVTFQRKIVVAGLDVVEVRWRTSMATASVYDRTLSIIRVP